MKLKVIVHPAEEGGYWAEVPAIPGCATQGETFEELRANLYEAIAGYLLVAREPRPFGLCTGEFRASDDFDAPLPVDVLDAFELDL